MMVWKEARRSFTGELRWLKKEDYFPDEYPDTLFEGKTVLQQRVLIEGTEDGLWVQRHEWKDVELVKEGYDGGKQTGL